MLKEFEKKLLKDVIENPETYDSNMGCNDWEFPSYMTQEEKREMVIKTAYWNDDGEEIREHYDDDDDKYYNAMDYLMNFEVPFYLKKRLEEEGII